MTAEQEPTIGAARRPPRPCSVAGCWEDAPPGCDYCSRHAKHRRQQAAEDPQRAADHRWYQSARWRALRAKVLQDPFDAVCRVVGCGELSTQVDHIVPRRLRPDLQWSRANLQGLCSTHHSAKTACEQRGVEWTAELRQRPAADESE